MNNFWSGLINYHQALTHHHFPRTFATFLVIYGILALTHIAIQILFSIIEWLKQKRMNLQFLLPEPGVTVVVPVYNEKTEIIRACVESIRAQNYKNLLILVVDDGSKNIAEHQEFYTAIDNGRVKVITNPENHGKRSAQKIGFDNAVGDIIVTVDSDTILHDPDALHYIVRRFVDPKIGAVTGNISVENAKVNLLTRLINYRYWTAFNQERSAESLFGVVMCCSGPFSAYRKSIIDEIKDTFVAQTFLGRGCTYGDDRHLTNLVLATGADVVYDIKATASTYVPQSLPAYLRQQLRWSKSFYREMKWTVPTLTKHNIYLAYDLVAQLILPLFLLVALGAAIYEAIAFSPVFLLYYLVVLILIAILRSLYGILRTRDLGFLLFVVYGFVHILLIIPVHVWAIFTLRNNAWGTRNLPTVANGNGDKH